MYLRNPKHLEVLMLGLMAVAGAGICRIGWGGPPPRRALSPGELEAAALQDSFRVPPDDSKIMVRWWWFGPAVTTEELDREMRAMKDAGIGGFEVATLYPLTLDDPSKGLVNLHYLSPEHLAAVSFTARRAHKLGLRMDMTMGSGWPYGGPHITPELAAEGLRCLRIPIKEGERTVSGPPLNEGQRFLAAFVASGDGHPYAARSVHQVAPQEDGSFRLPPSAAGPRVLLFFMAALTGQQVKRAAVGAEGNVLDHYDRAALQKHLEAVGAPLAAAGGGNIRAMFCDSLEVYESDWTADFLKEFQRRRGYDLTPHLPALVEYIGTQTADIRHDWGQTLSELLNENFLEPYQSWCRQHHVLARVQAYGTPPAQLSSYRFVDLPEGEQGDEAGHWNHFTASRWASSAGHIYGKQVISAEAWTWIHSLPFRATPLDFKAFADEYFLEGINQLIGHGWPYSPPGVPEPGWHMYAAGALNPHNPWWFAMPDLALYLQRASFMLRQGRPAND
ncbi:MAG: glycosyl hydrolase, partial [Acidobacteriota bacterium]|nr:glycosyl hydrolase [Acidobacteriota bacterium]